MSKINYEKLLEITIKSQEELDMIPLNFKGRIYIEFGTYSNKAIVKHNYYYRVEARGSSSVLAWGNSSVKALGNSSVVAWDNSSVEARGNSSVEAWGNSSVVAWGNSSVEALGNSSVVAWDNSSVEARGNSSVVVRENSSVVARENSSVMAWENSSVVAWGNSSVKAWENSSVEAWENSSVVAWDNSSVMAWGNSSVVAWGNSSVVAWGNSSVMAWENSSVEAWENSSVKAWENSSVKAWGNSSVVAWENSSVVALGNVQVVDYSQNAKIQISGNARIVYNPKTIHEFMNFHGIKHTKTKAIFYKAARKDSDGVLRSDCTDDFTYEIGKFKTEDCCTDVDRDYSYGIHISHLNWALNFGKDWRNLTILEVETKITDIVLPKQSDGKIRTSKIKVLREIPLEECGTFGKILAKRRERQLNQETLFD